MRTFVENGMMQGANDTSGSATKGPSASKLKKFD